MLNVRLLRNSEYHKYVQNRSQVAIPHPNISQPLWDLENTEETAPAQPSTPPWHAVPECMCSNVFIWEGSGQSCAVGASPAAGTSKAGSAPCCKLLMQQDWEKGISWSPAVTDYRKMKIQHLRTCSPDGEGRKSHYRVTGDEKPKSTSATHPHTGD